MTKRILIAAVAAALVGAMLLPGRFNIDIHIGLNDVVNAIGMTVIIAGVFIGVMTWRKDDD